MHDGADAEDQTSAGRGQRLLELARTREWDVESALPWERLDLQRVSPSVRRAMATIHASTLHAERLALRLVDRSVDLAPEGLLRDFARCQRADEARHVAFFTRIVGQLSQDSCPTTLVALEQEISDVDDFDEIMIHGQVIETAGQVLFSGTTKRGAALLRSGVRLPGSQAVATVLACINDRVASDEARHVAFVTWYLRQRFRTLDAQRRRSLLDRAAISAQLTYDAFASLGPAYARVGVDVDELLSAIRRRTQSQLEWLEACSEAPAATERAPHRDGSGGGPCD